MRLTARQIDVLRLLGKGYTNAQIAGRLLVVCVRTVDSHVAAVLAKLGAGQPPRSRCPRGRARCSRRREPVTQPADLGSGYRCPASVRRHTYWSQAQIHHGLTERLVRPLNGGTMAISSS